MVEIKGCADCIKIRFHRSNGGSFCVISDAEVNEVHTNVEKYQQSIPPQSRTKEKPVTVCDHQNEFVPN